jgi:Flp pilus assembly protein TadG
MKVFQERAMKISSNSGYVKIRKGIFRSQSGQSLTELAILTPMLLLLCIGVIEVGRYAYISILVGNAARAGAGYGAQSLPLSGDTAGIAAAATNDFQNNGQTGMTVVSTDTCGCDSGGTVTSAACNGPNQGKCASGHWVVMVNVTASGSFTPILNYPGIPTPLQLSNTASMRVAQQ